MAYFGKAEGARIYIYIYCFKYLFLVLEEDKTCGFLSISVNVVFGGQAEFSPLGTLSVAKGPIMEDARAKLKATGIFINNGLKAASADGRTFAVVNPFNKQASRRKLAQCACMKYN